LASSSEILDLGKKVIDSIGLLAGEPSINNSQFERKINWFDEITIGPSEIEKFQFATSAERRNEIERINPLLRIKKHDQYKIVFSQGKIISIYSGNPLLIDFPNDDIGQELNNLKTNHISHCSLSVFLPPIIGENDEIKLKWPKSFHEGGSFKSSSTGFYDSIKITGMDEIIMDNRVLSYETSYYSDDNFESFTKSSNIRSISCINYEPINQYFKNKNEKDRNIANVMNKLFNFNRTLANSLGFGRIMIYDEEKL